MLSEFQKGKPITAKDLNAIVQAVVKLMNITGNGGIAVTKNANGFSILAEPNRYFMFGTLTKELPYDKVGVVRVYELNGSESELPTADEEAGPEDDPGAGATTRYEWARNWCLEGGKKLTASSHVVCVRLQGWWVIVAASPCPVDLTGDEGEGGE